MVNLIMQSFTVAHKGFPIAQPCLQLMQELDIDIGRPEDIKRLEKFLKGKNSLLSVVNKYSAHIITISYFSSTLP